MEGNLGNGSWQIAVAVMGAWAGATAFWFGVGAVIWKLFFDPRLAELKGMLDAERIECERAMDNLRVRINQLETVLMMHGNPDLRSAIQRRQEGDR